MSLASSMQSWCDNFKIKCSDRTATITKITKHSHHVVQRHNDHRVNMGVKIREILQIERTNNKKKVDVILKSFIKDRGEAFGILTAMRNKSLHSKKE